LHTSPTSTQYFNTVLQHTLYFNIELQQYLPEVLQQDLPERGQFHRPPAVTAQAQQSWSEQGTAAAGII
jgi:hypothetical protein